MDIFDDVQFLGTLFYFGGQFGFETSQDGQFSVAWATKNAIWFLEGRIGLPMALCVASETTVASAPVSILNSTGLPHT